MNLNEDQLNRARGVLIGQAVGDALGVPYEFVSKRTDDPHMIGGGLGHYAPGEWSDDTQMAAGIALALAEGHDVLTVDGLDTVAAWFEVWLNSSPADIGTQTLSVLSDAKKLTGSASERLSRTAAAFSARNPNRSDGNGSVMRTSVIGISNLDDRTKTWQAAQAVSALTHAGRLAREAAAMWSDMVRQAVLGGDFSVWDAVSLLPEDSQQAWSEMIEAVLIDGPGSSLVPTNSSAHGAFLSALWAVQRGNSFDSSLRLAISLGGDTDTVAAITGGLSGAFWGLDAIPTTWVNTVHGWPGLDAVDLINLTDAIVSEGVQD